MKQSAKEFKGKELTKEQLLAIKGGNGNENPPPPPPDPEDNVGVEDIVNF